MFRSLDYWHPGNFDSKSFTTPEGVQEMIKLSDEHYDKLREFGADVPELNYTIGGNGLTVFTTSDFIPSNPLDLENLPPARLVIEQLIKPVIRYFEWVCDTKQPHALIDLFPPRRSEFYGGEQFSTTPDNSRLFLHDTPPRVIPTSSSYFRMQSIFELEDMWVIASKLELEMPDEEWEQLSKDWFDVLTKLRALRPEE